MNTKLNTLRTPKLLLNRLFAHKFDVINSILQIYLFPLFILSIHLFIVILPVQKSTLA
jgi:hypothetical protein